MASPIKLSHIVLQTNKPRELREWYCTVLGAEIVHENDFISFISYDDEHHRVAFLRSERFPLSRRCEGIAAMPRAICRKDRFDLLAAMQQVGVIACWKVSNPGLSGYAMGVPEDGVASCRRGRSSSCLSCSVPGPMQWLRTMLRRRARRSSPAL
jgi:hypothetical protein